MDVPTQEVITRDNVTVSVNAVIFFRVVEPSDSVVQVEDYQSATANISQTTLRNVVDQSDLDDPLSIRETVNRRFRAIIDEATESWGIKVGIVKIRDVLLPQSMQRAMARQAEAEREASCRR